jgi:hypothetical protein
VQRVKAFGSPGHRQRGIKRRVRGFVFALDFAFDCDRNDVIDHFVDFRRRVFFHAYVAEAVALVLQTVTIDVIL